MEIVKRPHANHIVGWAEGKPEVVVLSADLTASCEADTFRDTYPERFFSMGMAEQTMLSFAGGMAREGFTPFVHTFAVFICRRAYDQIAMSVAYPNLPVRLFGFLPGITTSGGATHQAIDDVALMRAVPNMTVLECGDATEVEGVLDVAQAVAGPVYVRMLRGDVPRLFPSQAPMTLGRARTLCTGGEIAVISSGICTAEAIRAVTALADVGVRCNHLHVSTLKPFNADEVLTVAQGCRGVVTLENHSIVGGLGSAVAEALAEAGAGQRLVRLGLQDTYPHGGSREYLMQYYGLDAAALVAAVERLLDTQLGIEPEALQKQQVLAPAVHTDAKPEAL